jgi:hypothetical protein
MGKLNDTNKNEKTFYPQGDPKKSNERQIADLVYGPEFRAICGGESFNKNIREGLGLNDIISTLRESVAEVKAGKMDRVEATLITQANTLDLVFNSLLRRAACQEMLPQYETFMRLALKAQSQCRTTLETLAEIKNPKPMAFIKQQNMAAVQQVNNTLAQEKKNRPNELLEGGGIAERVDTGTETQTIEAHSRLEALEEIRRSKNSGREDEILAKRLQGR